MFPPGVQVLQPGIRGALVVPSVPTPSAFERQVTLEAQRQVRAGHDPAGEEVTAHPITGTLVDERIGAVAMAEDVHEEATIHLEPLADAAEQQLVVTHVLEHFDRHDPVVLARRVEAVHVAGDDLDVVQPPLAGQGLDELALRRRVGNRGYRAIREMLRNPQGQRSPATAQVEHVHAVFDARAGAGDLQGQGLGVIERPGLCVPVAGAVLQAGAEHQIEEGRRHLVMLLVGEMREWRYDRRVHVIHEGVHAGRGPLAVAGLDLLQPLA